MNVHEDLQRDGVTTLAKPVLFGNGYRLADLHERHSPFTEKCILAANSNSTALVFTPDLFAPAKYLSENADEDFAKGCREAILATTGRVLFPDPPNSHLEVEPINNIAISDIESTTSKGETESGSM